METSISHSEEENINATASPPSSTSARRTIENDVLLTADSQNTTTGTGGVINPLLGSSSFEDGQQQHQEERQQAFENVNPSWAALLSSIATALAPPSGFTRIDAEPIIYQQSYHQPPSHLNDYVSFSETEEERSLLASFYNNIPEQLFSGKSPVRFLIEMISCKKYDRGSLMLLESVILNKQYPFLLYCKCNGDVTLLYWLVLNQRVDILKLFRRYKVPIPKNCTDKNGNPILMSGCSVATLDFIVKNFSEDVVSVMEKNEKNGDNFFHFQAKQNSIKSEESLKWLARVTKCGLLETGSPNINELNNNNKTPIHEAVVTGNLIAVKILVEEFGANWNIDYKLVGHQNITCFQIARIVVGKSLEEELQAILWKYGICSNLNKEIFADALTNVSIGNTSIGKKIECMICRDVSIIDNNEFENFEKWFKTECCGKIVHCVCLYSWCVTSSQSNCLFCREPFTEYLSSRVPMTIFRSVTTTTTTNNNNTVSF